MWNTHVVFWTLAVVVERILEYELWARYESGRNREKNISNYGM